jgi:hypothetical protein
MTCEEDMTLDKKRIQKTYQKKIGPNYTVFQPMQKLQVLEDPTIHCWSGYIKIDQALNTEQEYETTCLLLLSPLKL